MIVIDGQQIALRITQRVAREIFENSKKTNSRPGLAIVLAGNREDSEIYIDIKQATAREMGIDTHLYRINEQENTEDVVKLIEHLNKDEEVSGILVQLPLPEKYDTDRIISTISPGKDVDCFHPENVKKLDEYKERKPFVLSPVYATVLEMIDYVSFDLKGSVSVVVANSDIFGGGLQKVLEAEGSKSEVIFTDDKLFSEKIKKADLLVTAVGKRNLITADMIKPNSVVIDVGITKEDGKIYGDVDFNETKEMALAITPVPGGVGPVVVAKVLENTWKLSQERIS
ncbi:MAG TPA: bifunctional 5,10-methylenetetrahydrofolate dehydrogenase/5,10-methenyltetrahydrofolate cyclohydrolase [Lutibacter sp.]|nr:bifunctional 5,10-methylenetetrahydrofolate dehydrogenase/5,10-methenyltetrahydrofolate cyclohydrolase [Lutibacter sp.]